ncbi:MAG: DUF503 domain-containing protein [Elusimicrobiota bacterium]
MFIGAKRIEIYLPGIRSLKEKRKYINSLKDKIKNELNLSVAEINHQDLLQRSEIGICGVSHSRRCLKQIFQNVKKIMDRYPQLNFNGQEVSIEKK